MNTWKCPPCIQTVTGDYRLSPLTPAEYSSFSPQQRVGGCFKFVLNVADNIEIFLLLLDKVTQSQGLFYSFFVLPCWQAGWRCMGSSEETETQNGQRHHDMTSCLAYKEGGRGDVCSDGAYKEGGRGDICSDHVCFPPKPLLGVMLPRRGLNISLLMWRDKFIPCFALLVYLLLSLLNCPYLNPWVFFLLSFSFSPSSRRWGNGAWLVARVDPQHHITHTACCACDEHF